jgi:hypothetical protein
MSDPQPASSPVVKPIPTYKKGETVIHKETGTDLKILEIKTDNQKRVIGLRCDGIGNLVHPNAVEKKL